MTDDASLDRVGSLAIRIVTGYFWTLGGGLLRSALKVLVLVILARLLVPTDFGLVGAAMIFVEFVVVLGQIGVAPAIVQRKELTEADVRTGWTLTLVFGALVGVLTYLVAPWIADLFQIDELTPVLRVLALIVPLRSIGIVAEALLQRQMRFRAMAAIELSSFAFGYAGVAIMLAYAGLGVWSLVIGYLAQMTITSVGSVALARHSAKPALKRSSLVRLSRFGAGITLSGIGNFVAVNADTFVVGRWLGAEALGHYSRAYYFLMQPTHLIGTLGDKVLFPAISSIQSHHDRVRNAYCRSVSLVALITSPLSAILFVLAPEFVLVLLGEQWSQMVPPFQVLVLMLPFRTAYKITDTLLRAQGFVYALARIQWLYATTVVLAAYLGHFYGLQGVAIGVGLAVTAFFWIGVALAKRLCEIPASRIAGAFGKYAIGSAVLAALLYLLKQSAEDFQLSALALIVSAGVISFVALGITWFAVPQLFGDEGAWVRKWMSTDHMFFWNRQKWD